MKKIIKKYFKSAIRLRHVKISQVVLSIAWRDGVSLLFKSISGLNWINFSNWLFILYINKPSPLIYQTIFAYLASRSGI